MPMPLQKIASMIEELIGAGYSASKASKYKSAVNKFANAGGSSQERYLAANQLTAKFGDAATPAAKKVYAEASAYQKSFPADLSSKFGVKFPDEDAI